MEWTVGTPSEAENLSERREVVAIMLTFTVLMILVVVLPTWIRRRTLHREDWIIGSCMICSTGRVWSSTADHILSQLSSIVYSAACIARKCDRSATDLRTCTDGYAAETRYGCLTLISSTAQLPSRPFYLRGIAGFELALCITFLRMTADSIDRQYHRLIVPIAAFSTLAQTATSFTARRY